jgi:hypothetical protein
MHDTEEEPMAEVAERWEADAATLRAMAARRLAEGDVESARMLHELAIWFEAQAQRPDTKLVPLVT